MAPFGKRFPSRHAIIAACYQDEFATNFNLSNWCKYKPLLLVVGDARNVTFDGDTSLRRGFTEHKGGRRARWSILGAKAKK